MAHVIKKPPAMWETPGLERSPGEGKGYPYQYSGLENSMDCIVHGGHKESDMTERLSLKAERGLLGRVDSDPGLEATGSHRRY